VSSAIPVPRVISCAGFVTSLGGGRLSPRVKSAMAEATDSTWRPDDLQRWAGEVIAELTGAEAGWVTNGAAAGMTLATAACIAGRSNELIDRVPAVGDRADGILIQRGHRNAYDRAFRTAGARLVEVGYPLIEGVGLTYEWQLEAALDETIVAIGHLALADDAGVPLRRVCELARERQLSVIVDAAAELPPVANLRRFVADGASAVVFSGGKAIRGPQASGVLAATRELIDSVRLQTLDMDIDAETWLEREGRLPPHHGIGRSMKVGKEEIVGLVVALQEFVERDHDAEREELRAWLVRVADRVGENARVVDEVHFYPRLVADLPSRWSAREAAAELAAQDPAVVLPHAPLARAELVLCPEAIAPADRQHVERSLMDVVARHRTDVAPA